MAEQRDRKRRKPLLLQWFEYVLFRTVRGLLRILPPWLIRSFGSAIGWFCFRAVRSRTDRALRNLAHVMPERTDAERREMIERCWKHFSVETLEYIRVGSADPEEVRERIDVIGADEVARAVALGRGLMVYSAHFGPWEWAIGSLNRVKLPVAIVARPLDNELLDEMLINSRRRFDVEMVPKRNAARALMKKLSRREAVLILPDQAVSPREGILVPFLGRPAWTTPAPARLALRHGAPIVGLFGYRRGDRVVVELTPPILTHELDETPENIEHLTRQINDEISRRVMEEPTTWLWMHDRWKRAD